MNDLKDTASYLKRGSADDAWYEGVEEWRTVLTPLLPVLLDEQIKLNDPGASLYLIQQLSAYSKTAYLKFCEGEVYRLRGEPGDDALAGSAYAEAVAIPDAPGEAWRAYGYAAMKAGKGEEMKRAFARYLEINPAANDAEMIRFALAQ